ncbi:MAG: hypothetical protein EXR79_03740 [Myxococcales bacterium]|nr:hypothetical protein [Myxococcales bacterium]
MAAIAAESVPGRLTDIAIATALCLGTVGLLVATADAGFTRDEAFYFGHAETYQDWVVQLQRGGKARADAMERTALLDTWRNNGEHPPLDKWLFGLSWRVVGRKLRPIGNFRLDGRRIVADVDNLGPSHGFSRGGRIALLVPQLVGRSAAPDGRQWMNGEIIERKDHRATVRLDATADLDLLQRRCPAAGPIESAGTTGATRLVLRTSCEAVEQRLLYVLSESQAMRLPGMVFAGLLVAAIFLAARLFFVGATTVAGFQPSRAAAATVAVGYLTIPQPFWHAHLAAFDTTIVALLFLTTFAYLRSLRHPGWAWVAGVLWGISLLAKHNALFLPVPLIALWLWDALAEERVSLSGFARGRRGPVLLGVGVLVGVLAWKFVHPLAGMGLGLLVLADRHVRLALPPLPSALFVMLPVGFAILVAGWPLLWVDTADNLVRWIEFHLHHEHYMQSYFGQVLAYPPFPTSFAWAMTLFTVPLTLLAVFALGFAVVHRPRTLPDALRRLLRLPEPALSDIRGPPPTALRAPSAQTGARRRKQSSHYLTAWTRMDAFDAVGRTAELRAHDRLVLLSVLWPLALISLPGTPIFGGTKHWMSAFPFMLVLGARGLDWVLRTLEDAIAPPQHLDPQFNPTGTEAALARMGVIRVEGAAAPGWFRARLCPAVLTLVLVGLVLVPAAVATADVHPHGSAYYNELVGGLPGAAERDMQRQFWGGTTREGLEEINRRAPRGASVWFHKSAWGAYQMYVREGWLRHDLRYSGGPEGTQLGLYHHQRDHDDYELEAQREWGTRAPVWQADRDGVALLSVYERPLPPSSAGR